MSELPGNVICAQIGCQCHRDRSRRSAELGAPFDCLGAMQIFFPVSIFEPAGELGYRQQREKFVRDATLIFDSYYERARVDLESREPLVLRPQRQGRRFFLVYADDTAPAGGNGKDETDETVQHSDA